MMLKLIRVRTQIACTRPPVRRRRVWHDARAARSPSSLTLRNRSRRRVDNDEGEEDEEDLMSAKMDDGALEVELDTANQRRSLSGPLRSHSDPGTAARGHTAEQAAEALQLERPFAITASVDTCEHCLG